MSNMDEQDIQMERIVRRFIDKQLSHIEGYSEEDNNSFVFLEKSTLNVLIAYMLLGKQCETSEKISEDVEQSILQQLDQIMLENKAEFESVIHLLKELS